MTTMKLEDFMSSYIPLPICVINKKGRVISAGDKIGQVFLYDGIVDSDIFALTGIRASELYAAAEAGSHPLLKRNGKIFKLMCNKVSDDSARVNPACSGARTLGFSTNSNCSAISMTSFDIL